MKIAGSEDIGRKSGRVKEAGEEEESEGGESLTDGVSSEFGDAGDIELAHDLLAMGSGAKGISCLRLLHALADRQTRKTCPFAL